ncbi:UvrB/UvrC motif-containing protein [Brassicibacter mesophilus]|jgi:protein arginine kinase activator|uniref:UvrB/UvrC motif-containing protein n=1 Tax=Brassicibacter mesophilus TaxID=745119 RepID=UPI003D19E28A
MLCEECGKNQSTVHMTKIINNKVTELHLCEECAKKHKQFDFDAPFSIQNFLTGLLDNIQDSPMKVDYIKSVTCDKCGLTYGKFRQMGKFGCSSCYKSFNEKLVPLFKRIHGHDTHVGKVPKRAGGTIRIRKEINNLKEELELAVKNEKFEEAAELRDKIKSLQSELESNEE